MSKARRAFVGLLILTMLDAGAWAQAPAPVAIGKVVGPGGAPVAGAPLQVQGPQGKTVVYTDAKGQWSLYNLPAGTYSVAPLNKTAPSDQPVQFSIKDKGVIDKLFGNADTTFFASEIKLNSN
jgi:expansin (peptidoglycan-binding protein)